MARRRAATRRGLVVVLAAALLGAAPAAVSPAAAADDTTFTIVVVPDTQNEVVTDSPLMSNRYQWVADHKQSDNIRFVVHTGDVTNWGVADPVQFTRASTATKVLDTSGIPYAYATGNHDGAAVTTGGSAAAGNVRANLRNTAAFNTTFPLSRFKNVGGTFEAGKVDNMYQTFSAGGKDWLVLTMELWPRSAAITWAQGVLAAHPKHNVIINTHVNIDSGGGRQTTGIYGDNSAQVLWDQLGSRYANVRMILSGHYEPRNGSPGAAYNQVTGVNGNKVIQVMTAYSSPFQNHLRTLKVDTKANTVTSAVLVPLSTNKAHPSGKITDVASSFVASGMSFVDPAAAPAPATQLLPDGGFEKGAGGWVAFGNATMTRVTSPVRSGSSAMKVTSTSPTYSLVGMTQNTVVTSSTKGKTYTASCYVRPSTAGLEVRIRLLQYTQNFGGNDKLGTTIVTTLPANTWTKVAVTGTATASGQRIVPQIYASFQTVKTGHLVYDDCSLS